MRCGESQDIFAWQGPGPFEIRIAVEPLSVASDPAASGKVDSSERAQGTGPRRSDSRIERRVPNARESAATLPDIDTSEFDFEPHDTIPAPPWLEDELSPLPKP